MEKKHAQKSILIVDDTPHNLAFVHAILRSEYQVFFALNGADAVQTALSKPLDLILLDIAMPETDGFEVCQQLKSHEKTKNVPIVFLTASSAAEDEIRGLELGAVGFITKPVNSSALKAKIKKILA